MVLPEGMNGEQYPGDDAARDMQEVDEGWRETNQKLTQIVERQSPVEGKPTGRRRK
ncbi:unnamed protein product [Ectocarpus sp. 12 AP-2014]